MTLSARIQTLTIQSLPSQDDGIMDQEIDGEGAINLSTSQRPSAATTPNDGVQSEDVEQVSQKHLTVTCMTKFRRLLFYLIYIYRL